MTFEIQVWRHGVRRKQIAIAGEKTVAVNCFRYEASHAFPGEQIELLQIFGSDDFPVQLLVETKDPQWIPSTSEDNVERDRR